MTTNSPDATETTPSPAATTTEPTADPSTPAPAEPSFGWNRYAEVINGRFAMVGFVALLIQELITRQDFFTWLGLR